MADEEKKAKGGKPDKAAAGGGKPAGAAQAKGGKAAAAGKGAPRGKDDRRAAKGGDKQVAPSPRPADYRPRMKSIYESVVRDALKTEFGYGNAMQIPRIEKVVINMGVGAAVNDRKKVDSAAKDLSMIAGQRAVVTRARKSIATYKLRDGMPIGCKVTLRGDRMYEFYDRLMAIALPRIRDFRGINPGSFDGRGNFSMGVREQIIFPEINYDDIHEVRGLTITITTSAATDDQARELLRAMGMPFATDEGRF